MFSTLIFISALAVAAPLNEAALNQALHRYQNVRALEVNFEQIKVLKEMRHPLRARGHLSVHPPDSVIYRITTPAPLEVSLTPQKITIVSGSGADKTTQTVNVADLSGSSEQRQMQAMIAWLRLDPKQLASQYDVNSLDGDAHPHQFKFTPRTGQAAPFTSLQLKLSSKDEVQGIVMNETSGDQIEFVFEAPKLTYKAQ